MGAWRKYILVLFIFSVALSGNALLRGFWLFVQMPDDHKVGANTSKSTTTTTENTNPTLVEPTPKPRQNVILLSSFMRSGSSVIGDIFNNHPDCFYMFEPLHETVLLSLYNCIFWLNAKVRDSKAKGLEQRRNSRTRDAHPKRLKNVLTNLNVCLTVSFEICTMSNNAAGPS